MYKLNLVYKNVRVHKADDVIYKLLLRVKTVVSFADCELSALKGSGTIQAICIITVDSFLDNSHHPISKAASWLPALRNQEFG